MCLAITLWHFEMLMPSSKSFSCGYNIIIYNNIQTTTFLAVCQQHLQIKFFELHNRLFKSHLSEIYHHTVKLKNA